MLITTGNAAAMPSFRGWFIGPLNNWASREFPGAEAKWGLQESSVVEMKWGSHAAGETRSDWATCLQQRTMSVLVRGRFLLRFRHPDHPGQIREERLLREGDFAIWDTDVEHTWVVEEDSVIFTVRWKE